MRETVAKPTRVPVEAPAMPAPWWSRYPAATVAAVATLLAFVVTFPLIFHLTTATYGTPGDSTGTIATFWWWGYALHHGLPLLNNTLLGAPLGSGWDLSPFSPLPLAVFAPLSAVIGPTAAYNLGVLSSFPLTAWVTYLLGRQLKLSPLAAAFAALAFAFMPYHVEKAMGHMIQAHMELFAASLLFLVRWWRAGSPWNLVAAGVVAGLTLWTDFYFAFILLFLMAGFFALSLVRPHADGGISLVRRLGTHLAGAGLLAAVAFVFVPAAVLLAHRPGTGGFEQAIASDLTIYRRSLFDIQVYSMRPWEFFLPWHSNPLLPRAAAAFELQHLHQSNFTEQSLVLGYTVVALALLAILVARNTFAVLLGLVLAAEGVLLALPPNFHVLGVHLVGPSYFLNRVVPFFRVYSRFGLLALLGAALLAGVGFMALQGRLSRTRPWLLALPFLLLAVEFNNQPPNHVTILFPAPPEYQWLRTQPAGILVEYPLAAGPPAQQEIQTRQYALYQQTHEHPMFNGAHPSSPAGVLALDLEPYYKPGIASQLEALGIRYVFVHRADYLADGYDLPRAVGGMRYVATIGDTDIFILG